MPLFRQTLRLAVPSVIEQFFISGVFLVDALMVASLGPAPLAAAGLAGVVMWRLTAMSGVLGIGIGAATSRRTGEGRLREASVTMTHGLALAFAAGTFCLIFVPGAGPLFRLLRAEGDVFREVVPYFQIVVLCLPMRLAAINASSSIRAAGNTRVPMLITLLANVANVFFNYIFIFGHLGVPAMGLKGAALGTFMAIFVEFIILFLLMRRGLRVGRVFHSVSEPGERTDPIDTGDHIYFLREGLKLALPTVTRNVIRIAHPVFWEEAGITFGFLCFISMIAGLGEMSLAAHTAIVRIESFSFLAGFGVAIAAATLVGQALGAKDIPGARRSFSMCLTLGASAMGVWGILFALFPHWFLSWFIAGPQGDFSNIAIPLMILISLEQPFIGTTMVLANGLRGAGMTTAPFLAQITGVTLIRVGVGYFLAYNMNLGLEGLYIATIIDWIVRTSILSVIVLRGKWVKAVA